MEWTEGEWIFSRSSLIAHLHPDVPSLKWKVQMILIIFVKLKLHGNLSGLTELIKQQLSSHRVCWIFVFQFTNVFIIHAFCFKNRLYNVHSFLFSSASCHCILFGLVCLRSNTQSRISILLNFERWTIWKYIWARTVLQKLNRDDSEKSWDAEQKRWGQSSCGLHDAWWIMIYIFIGDFGGVRVRNIMRLY